MLLEFGAFGIELELKTLFSFREKGLVMWTCSGGPPIIHQEIMKFFFFFVLVVGVNFEVTNLVFSACL